MYESMYGMAERVRFELTDPFGSTVFKTERAMRGTLRPLSGKGADKPRLTLTSMYESMYGR